MHPDDDLSWFVSRLRRWSRTWAAPHLMLLHPNDGEHCQAVLSNLRAMALYLRASPMAQSDWQ